MRIRNTRPTHTYYQYAGSGRRNGAHMAPNALSVQLPAARLNHPGLLRDLAKGHIKVLLDPQDASLAAMAGLKPEWYEVVPETLEALAKSQAPTVAPKPAIPVSTTVAPPPANPPQTTVVPQLQEQQPPKGAAGPEPTKVMGMDMGKAPSKSVQVEVDTSQEPVRVVTIAELNPDPSAPKAAQPAALPPVVKPSSQEEAQRLARMNALAQDGVATAKPQPAATQPAATQPPAGAKPVLTDAKTLDFPEPGRDSSKPPAPSQRQYERWPTKQLRGEVLKRGLQAAEGRIDLIKVLYLDDHTKAQSAPKLAAKQAMA